MNRLTRHTIAVAAAFLALAPSASAGDGTFTGGPDLPVAGASDIGTGDFNNDGRPDLAALSGTNDRVELFLQTAGGELQPGTPVAVGDGPILLAVADFNADGNDDVVTANDGDDNISVRLGTGKGTFTAAKDIVLGMNPHALVVADVNADLRDDLVSAGVTTDANRSRQIVVSFGGGNDGGFPSAKTLAHKADALAVADFNGDAREDLAFGGILYGSFGNVLPGTGSGAFDDPLQFPLGRAVSSSKQWATGDFNSDSKTDLVVAEDLGGVAVRLGTGDGKFTAAQTVAVEGFLGAVAVGDFNSDGNEDLVVTGISKAGGRAYVLLGDGAGGFQRGADANVGFSADSVVVADFNSDGTDDLAITSTGRNSVGVRLGGGPASLAGNLLTNGGFEGPVGAGKIPPEPRLPGWEVTGGTSFLRYGASSHAYAPSWTAAPRYGTGGGRLLWGGDSAATGGITTAFQTVDVAQSAESIDDGRATANLSAYLGGTLAYNDRMGAQAEFLSAAGGSLGSLELRAVTAQDRGNLTTMLRRASSARVPAGTRRIRVTLTSIDDDKTLSGATADNAKLTLTTTRSETPRAQAFGPDTLVTLAPARKRIGARQPVTVRVRNRNPFAVAARLGGRALLVPQAETRTVRVRLSTRVRRRLVRTHAVRVRVTAVVTDPAGNARRVTKRIRLRLKSQR